jgi:hypothetical protein
VFGERQPDYKNRLAWTGFGNYPILFGCFTLLVHVMEGVSRWFDGGLYLIFCLLTLREIYCFVAEESVARTSLNKNRKPTFIVRVKTVYLVLLHALIHYLYWSIPKDL